MGVFGGGSAPSCDFKNRIQQGRRGAKARDTLKPPCVFNLSPFGSLHSLLPNAPENNPTVFFPRLAGNDLTTARKRNVKHSLELFMTSELWGGPCASASLDIPEHTQPKLPTAGVNCCLAPTPKQSQKHTPPPPTSSPFCPVCEGLFFTSGSLLLTIVSWEYYIFILKTQNSCT